MHTLRLPALLVLSMLASAAQAHPGHGAPGFVSGLLHPLLGVDHLLAMLGIGLWTALRAQPITPGRALSLPALFVCGAALGTALGMAGFFNAGIEIAVAASLFLLGLALLFGMRSAHQLALCLVPICGVLHGGAHGTELAGIAGSAEVSGFLIGTALLHMLGLVIGLALPASRRRPLIAASGGGMAVAGIWLLA